MNGSIEVSRLPVGREDVDKVTERSTVRCGAALVLFVVVTAGTAFGTAQQRAFVEAELLVRLAMEVPVARETVWDAWTVADELVQWFPSYAEMTVTEGGEYRFGWDGWDVDWVGTYVEVDRPNRLVFTWQPPESAFPQGAYETTVVLTFEETEDDGTRLLLEHGGFRGGAEMESHLESWRGYLYNLRAYLLQR